jgi:MoaA/NifB/PqqE/SkfB family radical SAM enzyme
MSDMMYTNYRSKLLGHMDRLSALNDGQVLPPINVEIDLCNRCQLKCAGCHFAYTHSKGPYASKGARAYYAKVGDFIDESLINSVIHQMAEYGVLSITWTGGGEPTLHPHVEHITTVVKTCAIDQGMYTNGVHVDDEMAGVFGRTLNWVYVSLDCCDAETYKKEKGVDAFDAACEGVQWLAECVEVCGVGFLMHSENIDRMQEMADLAYMLGADYVQFRPTVEFDHKSPSTPNGKLQWSLNMVDIELPQCEIPIEFDRSRFHEYGNWKGHGYHECLWSGLQTVITPDGRMWTCCNKRGLETNCLGDLNKERFQDIWERREIADVNKQCRIMCRGHMPNRFLHSIMKPKAHANFI